MIVKKKMVRCPNPLEITDEEDRAVGRRQYICGCPGSRPWTLVDEYVLHIEKVDE